MSSPLGPGRPRGAVPAAGTARRSAPSRSRPPPPTPPTAGASGCGSGLGRARPAPPPPPARRGRGVGSRLGRGPPCPAEGVAPDQSPATDHGRQRPPGRTAPTSGPCATPGPTRHATAATLSMDELLARAARRDPSAWEEIMSRHNGVVWARVRSFRLQDADASDAVQMTWLQLAANCGRIQHPDRLAGWLATTATRECLQILRHSNRTATVDYLADTLTDPAAGPER